MMMTQQVPSSIPAVLKKSSKKSTKKPKEDMQRKKVSLPEILDELQLRFLMNLPQSELNVTERLFFQIEQCFWFYEDFYADAFSHLPHMKLPQFTQIMFAHSPLLQPLATKYDQMLAEFKTYQSQVPVNGCILLNEQKDKLVLVRNWRGTSWSFPRGKVNQGESDLICAGREAFEECGFDPTSLLHKDDYLEFVKDKQRIRMYIACDVPEDFPFAPQTRKEISLIQWFEFDQIPKKTWGVLPFMARLKRWIHKSKKKSKSKKKNDRAVSAPRDRPSSNLTSMSPSSEGKSMLQIVPPTKNKVKKHNTNRSVSTPHGRPKRKTNEYEQDVTYDDSVTFGDANHKGFTVEDMFAVNEQLTGMKFTYDGNPQDFGNVKEKNKVKGVQKDMHIADSVARFFTCAPSSAINNDISIIQNTVNDSPSENKMEEEGCLSFEFDMGDIMECVK